MMFLFWLGDPLEAYVNTINSPKLLQDFMGLNGSVFLMGLGNTPKIPSQWLNLYGQKVLRLSSIQNIQAEQLKTPSGTWGVKELGVRIHPLFFFHLTASAYFWGEHSFWARDVLGKFIGPRPRPRMDLRRFPGWWESFWASTKNNTLENLNFCCNLGSSWGRETLLNLWCRLGAVPQDSYVWQNLHCYCRTCWDFSELKINI